MTKMNVLLVCGSGASSGFMAANIRKAAADKGLDIKITARGESEIENYIDEIDALMVGPHLAYIMDEVEEFVGDSNVKVILMKPEYYATLNGEQALAHLLENVN
ncbi:PTS sugar transporter subunit IIB [Enterococcus sp. LJL99]